MEIYFSGSFTKDEYLNAAKLAARPVSKNTLITVDLWILLSLAGVSIVTVGIWQVFSDLPEFGFLLFFLGVIFLVIGLKLRNNVHDLWEKNDIFRVRRDGVITEDYIKIKTSSVHTHLQWSEFNGYGEYKGLMMLFQGTAVVAYPFSRRFFQNEDDWQQFIRLVKNKLKVSHQVNGLDTKNELIVLALIVIALIALVFQSYSN